MAQAVRHTAPALMRSGGERHLQSCPSAWVIGGLKEEGRGRIEKEKRGLGSSLRPHCSYMAIVANVKGGIEWGPDSWGPGRKQRGLGGSVGQRENLAQMQAVEERSLSRKPTAGRAISRSLVVGAMSTAACKDSNAHCTNVVLCETARSPLRAQLQAPLLLSASSPPSPLPSPACLSSLSFPSLASSSLSLPPFSPSLAPHPRA